MNDFLYLTDSIKNHVASVPPVIVVGLPRSGSSFLSDILSQMEELYVFDDLYLFREAKAIGVDSGLMNAEQVDKLLFFLGWQIRARINFGTFSIPNMDIDDVERMNLVLRELFLETPVTWYQMLEEWMLRLTYNQGSTRWGYKAPQDFLHVEVLKSCYPGAQFIFIQRDPRSMMRSLKYVHDNDGNPSQYHPVAYSLYWKSCAKQIDYMIDTKSEHLVVKFEDLVSNPDIVGKSIGDFVSCKCPDSFEIKKKNSSFQDKTKQNLTQTEVWIIEKLLNSSLASHGYKECFARPRLADLPGLFITTAKFTIYQVKRMLKKKSALVSIKSMLKSVFEKSR